MTPAKINPRALRISIRVTAGQKRVLQRAAELESRSLSTWALMRLRRAAREELDAAREKGR